MQNSVSSAPSGISPIRPIVLVEAADLLEHEPPHRHVAAPQVAHVGCARWAGPGRCSRPASPARAAGGRAAGRATPAGATPPTAMHRGVVVRRRAAARASPAPAWRRRPGRPRRRPWPRRRRCCGPRRRRRVPAFVEHPDAGERLAGPGEQLRGCGRRPGSSRAAGRSGRAAPTCPATMSSHRSIVCAHTTTLTVPATTGSGCEAGGCAWAALGCVCVGPLEVRRPRRRAAAEPAGRRTHTARSPCRGDSARARAPRGRNGTRHRGAWQIAEQVAAHRSLLTCRRPKHSRRVWHRRAREDVSAESSAGTRHSRSHAAGPLREGGVGEVGPVWRVQQRPGRRVPRCRVEGVPRQAADVAARRWPARRPWPR